jgi:hypothetical protein
MSRVVEVFATVSLGKSYVRLKLNLEPSYVLDQDVPRMLVHDSEFWQHGTDEMQKGPCPGIIGSSSVRVQDRVWLARWRHQPDVSLMRCQILRSEGRDIRLSIQVRKFMNMSHSSA